MTATEKRSDKMIEKTFDLTKELSHAANAPKNTPIMLGKIGKNKYARISKKNKPTSNCA